MGAPHTDGTPRQREPRFSMELLARIERVYLHLEQRSTPHGARAWFARQARVTPWTVSRWLSGARPFQGSPAAVLELLERRAGLTPTDTVPRCVNS